MTSHACTSMMQRVSVSCVWINHTIITTTVCPLLSFFILTVRHSRNSTFHTQHDESHSWGECRFPFYFIFYSHWLSQWIEKWEKIEFFLFSKRPHSPSINDDGKLTRLKITQITGFPILTFSAQLNCLHCLFSNIHRLIVSFARCFLSFLIAQPQRPKAATNQ